MRIPESETLKARGCPQKVHWPVVIGFFKRLCLLFTKTPSGTHERTAARFEKPDKLWGTKCRLQVRAEPLYSEQSRSSAALD